MESGDTAEIRLTKIPSLLRHIAPPRAVCIKQTISDISEGTVLAVEVLSTEGRRTSLENVHGETEQMQVGDIIPAVLATRRKFSGISCDIPKQIRAGDVLYWCSVSGMIGETRGSDSTFGVPAAMRVLGAVELAGVPVNLKVGSGKASRRRQLDTSAPIVCVAGTATNTGKTATARKIVKHYKEKGEKVACAKLTGSGLLAELRMLSDTGADLVLGFMDAGLPTTCGDDVEEVVEVALGILYELNKIEPDVIVVEFGSSLLGVYNAESVLCSPALQAHVAATVMTASDPTAAWGADKITKSWGIEITAFTGPLANNSSFREYVEETLQVPVEDNRAAIPRILGLIDRRVENFQQRKKNITAN